MWFSLPCHIGFKAIGYRVKARHNNNNGESRTTKSNPNSTNSLARSPTSRLLETHTQNSSPCGIATSAKLASLQCGWRSLTKIAHTNTSSLQTGTVKFLTRRARHISSNTERRRGEGGREEGRKKERISMQEFLTIDIEWKAGCNERTNKRTKQTNHYETTVNRSQTYKRKKEKITFLLRFLTIDRMKRRM